MIEQLHGIFLKISLSHINILLLLGLALFGGTVGGRLFQKLRVPQVVGYIVIGVLIGEAGLNIVSRQVIETLQPFNYFALGLIGFMVGGELRKDIFTRYGKQLMTILVCEGIAPFILVSALVGVFGAPLFGWKVSWALGLLFGAIASATDPATTTEVLREYKTRGPLTTTILGIVALDDGLALMLFAIASSIAGSLSGQFHEGILRTFVHPLYDIGGSVLLGGAIGFALCRILRKYAEKARLLAFTIGAILIITGLSLALNVEMLLTAMTAGIVVVNFTPRKSKEIFELVNGFTPPIYVLFFVLIGAKLNFSHITMTVALLVALYLCGTIVGKIAGSWFGAHISSAPPSVRRYLPLGLFSQAGVAIGLSILAAQYFPGQIGDTIVIVITTTTFVTQLVGPALTKVAVIKAREVGLNITEEDLVQQTTVRDVMEQNPPVIHKNDTLTDIVRIFSENSNLYYPVIDNKNGVVGIVSVDNIKQAVMEMDAGNLILAVDVMEPHVQTVSPDSMVSQAKELMEKHSLEYLAVTDAENAIVGFIERRMLTMVLSTKMLELQRKADSFDS